MTEFLYSVTPRLLAINTSFLLVPGSNDPHQVRDISMDWPARQPVRVEPQSPASDVDSAEFACKLLILPLFWRDGSFHPRGAGGREWRIGWISRSTLNWKPGWSPGMRGFPD